MAEARGRAYIAAHEHQRRRRPFRPVPDRLSAYRRRPHGAVQLAVRPPSQRYGDGGTFRLRIEDTDRQRSTPEAVAAIIDGLSWLGLEWDGEIVHQFARAARHAEVARELLARGRAYHCYCTPAELEAMRERARAEKRSVRYRRHRGAIATPPRRRPASRR